MHMEETRKEGLIIELKTSIESNSFKQQKTYWQRTIEMELIFELSLSRHSLLQIAFDILLQLFLFKGY